MLTSTICDIICSLIYSGLFSSSQLLWPVSLLLRSLTYWSDWCSLVLLFWPLRLKLSALRTNKFCRTKVKHLFICFRGAYLASPVFLISNLEMIRRNNYITSTDAIFFPFLKISFPWRFSRTWWLHQSSQYILPCFNDTLNAYFGDCLRSPLSSWKRSDYKITNIVKQINVGMFPCLLTVILYWVGFLENAHCPSYIFFESQSVKWNLPSKAWCIIQKMISNFFFFWPLFTRK